MKMKTMNVVMIEWSHYAREFQKGPWHVICLQTNRNCVTVTACILTALYVTFAL